MIPISQSLSISLVEFLNLNPHKTQTIDILQGKKRKIDTPSIYPLYIDMQRLATPSTTKTRTMPLFSKVKEDENFHFV